MHERFVGKNAIVTGGSQGIGLAMVEALAEEGATVYLWDINRELGKEIEKRLQAESKKVFFIPCDISSEHDISKAVESMEVHAIHLLFNNAGVELSKDVGHTSVSEWQKVCDVNLRGPFLVIKETLPLLEAAAGASIVNTSSISGLIGWPESFAYCSTKGGIVTMTKQLACDLAQKLIRVNCICPGTTQTPMIERLIGTGAQAQVEAQMIKERHLLKRFAEPKEIAQAALFLASDDASFVTGAILPVDGGYTAK